MLLGCDLRAVDGLRERGDVRDLGVELEECIGDDPFLRTQGGHLLLHNLLDSLLA